MKKIVALLLTLALSFALVGCGSSAPEILGVYETTMDVTEEIVKAFDEGTDSAELGMSLADYVSGLNIKVTSEFKEDGTFSQRLDEASAKECIDEMKTEALAFTKDFLFETVKNELAATGTAVETQEDLEAVLGMTFDEAIATALGTDIESFMDELFDFESLMDEFKGLNQEGNYKAKAGKLYLSASLDTKYDPAVYETYTIDGDVVTVTGSVNAADVEGASEISYPYVLVKVG